MCTQRALGATCALIGMLLFAPYTVKSQALDVTGVHYDVRNGLLDNNVIDGLVDGNGGLWLATVRGLSFFDGQRFINFTSQDSVYRISNNKIRAIAQRGEHIFIASDSTIDRIHARSKMVEKLPYVHKNGIIRHLINDKEGKLFLLSDTGDLVDVETGKSLNVGFEAFEYYNAFIGDENRILITNAKSDHIARVNLTTLNVEQLWTKQRDQPSRTLGLVASETYGCVNLLSTGAVRINEETGEETPIWRSIRDITGFNENLIDYQVFVSQFNAIQLMDATGRFIPVRLLNSGQVKFKKILTDQKRTVFALHDRGFLVFRVPPDFLSGLPTEQLNKLKPNVLYKSILEQPDGSVIIFSYDGMIEYDPATNGMRYVARETGNYVSGVLANGSMFVVSDGRGLLEHDPSTFEFLRRHSIDPSKIFERAYSIYKESEESLIIGYALPLGVWRFSTNDGKFEQIPIDFLQADSAFDGINSINKDEQGHYWIGSNRGLYHFDRDWKIIGVYSSLSEDEDSKISSNKINQVLIDSNKRIWVATDSGLYVKYPDQEDLIEITPFTGRIIASVEEDHYGRLWVATYLGLAVYDPRTNAFNHFYQEDGFPDNEYNIGSHLRASDNMLYFGGMNGITQVNPSMWVLDNQDLSLKFSSVHIERTSGIHLVDIDPMYTEPIHISSYADALTIQVGFMDYVNPAYSTFRYRLSGINDQWMSFDNGTLRLRNLPVGTYTVEIVGSHASGSSYDKPLRVPVVVTQPFFQSIYFPIIVIIAIVSTILAFLYLNYTHTIALRSITSNLLNDIQDELGGILSKAAMNAELLRASEPNPGKGLDEIQQLVREGVHSLRNILWSLNSENVTTVSFQDRVSDLLDFIFAGTGIEFIVTNNVPNAPFKLSIQQRRQLMPIIRELALNTIKHSNGTEFRVVLDKQKKNFRLTVYDNGRNLDHVISTFGHGLNGIAQRVEWLQGTVTFEKSADGFRTMISF